MIQVLTRDFGGSPLVKAALAHQLPKSWYAPVPTNVSAWTVAARQTATEFGNTSWLPRLLPALAPQGRAAEQLARVATNGGVVVTTGQQPGLFGGPIYTWSKALSAIAFARELERQTGIPTTPIFWAATDDADYTEASYTVVTHADEICTLRLPDNDSGAAMSAIPLGDVSTQFTLLAKAAGSAIDPEPLRVTQRAYAPGATIGSAYVTLLRAILEPLGMAVLDASHPAVRAAATPIVHRALHQAVPIRDALAERSRAIETAGYKAQVQPVPNLSLVFRTGDDGRRSRVSIKDASKIADHADATALSPNVLLRPIVERQILPTVTYVPGPSEFAYFAQVSAIADVLDSPLPRAVPRWSGTLLEPHVRDILQALDATPNDFQDPHAIEGRIAREELPTTVREAFQTLRDTTRAQASHLRDTGDPSSGVRRAVGGFEVQVEHRIARLERRYTAAIKRSGNARLRDVAIARASLFPNGTPQERALNIIPFVARYGTIVYDAMLDAAERHARALVGHD